MKESGLLIEGGGGGRFGEDKNLFPLSEIERRLLGRAASSLITTHIGVHFYCMAENLWSLLLFMQPVGVDKGLFPENRVSKKR
jgi:molybdopterin-guanine dinucleotide biosynthesis protein A